MGAEKRFGRPIPRREDRRLLLGKGAYLADIALGGVLECAFVRSTQPRARIRSLSNESGAHLYLWEDMAAEVGFLPPIAKPEGALYPKIRPLADGEVRFSGEPIGVLVGGEGFGRYRLEDALEGVEVEYEPLEPVFEVEAAAKPGSPLVYPELGTNTLYSSRMAVGDVEGALASSKLVVKRRLVFPANYGCALEPRGVLAKYDVGEGTLTVWSTTQWPHFLRTLLSEVLGHPESKIRVIAPDVGGGFGNKQDLYREEVVVAWLSRRLGRPVRWVASRSEDIRSTVQSGLQVHYAELGVGSDGRIRALRDKIYADLGSVGPMSFGPHKVTQLSMTGPYDFGAVEVELNCVATDRPPTGAYRGYGQQQAAYVLERLVEEAAHRLGFHPLELRLRNVVRRFPYTSPTGRVLDSGDYVGMIEACRRILGGEAGCGRRVGWGFAFGFESGGIGPSRLQESIGARHRGYESMRLRVEPDGSVSVYTGLSPHGQGLETALAQLCADLLGVELEEVRVHHGDTATTPYGYGTWGSRSAVVGAGALLECAQLLKRRVLEAASKIYDKPVGELEYSDGWVVSKRDGSRLASLKQVARNVYEGCCDIELEVSARYEPKGLTVSGGLHAALVEVDEETGQLRVLRYIVVHDSGTTINPLIVEGQILGGLAQGVGEALLEEYGLEGTTPTSLLDYYVPTTVEVPAFELEHHDTPSPISPLGLKGVGESGIVGPAAAIANAVLCALKLWGERTLEIPLKPEAVWRACKQIS